MARSNPRIPTVNIITQDPLTTLVLEGEVVGVPPAGATYAGIFSLSCELIRSDVVGIYEMTGTVAVPAWTLLSSGATGDQSSIQPQDEGVDLGIAGTWDTINWVGAGVTAVRVGDVVTVNIPGGSGGGSIYSVGSADNFAFLAGTISTFTTFSSPSIIATGNTGETTLAGVAPLFGSGSDTGVAAPYATAIADAAALHAQLIILTGTAIITPAAIETGDYGQGAGVFVPGIYTTAAAIGMTAASSITLDGDGDYVFISTGGAITFGATDVMNLINGASAARIFWVAATAITTGSTDTLYGTFLSGSGDIVIGSTNTIQGRLLSQNAITVDGTASTFSLPTGSGGTLPSGTTVTGTNTTGPTFQVINTSVYTGIGVDQTLANGLTTGTAYLISVMGLTTGIGAEIVADEATMTTGRYVSYNDGAGEVFGIGTNGHIISTVSAVPPTIAVTLTNGISAAAITAGGSDTAGVITTTGTNDNVGDSVLQVTFGKTYTVAPKGVVLFPANASGALNVQATGAGVYVSAVSATTFDITIPANAAAGATPSWRYIVIA